MMMMMMKGPGGGGERNSPNSVYSHIYTKPYPQNEQKKNDISKQLSKQAIRQAKLREITNVFGEKVSESN